MSNIINEIKKHNGLNEEADLEVIDKGFRKDEYTLVLGPRQKQILINAVEKNPYVLRYYFLKSASSAQEDLKLMKSLINDWWELYPERGYQNLRIISDDITYANRLEDESVVDEIVKSVDELKEFLTEEDTDFDYVDDAGYFRNGPFNSPVYILGAEEKYAIVKLLRSLGPTGVSDFKYPYGTADYMEECIPYNWVLMDYDKEWNTFYLYPARGQSLDIPEKYLVNIISQDILDKIKLGENINEEFEVIDSTSTTIAEALAEKIGDCVVVDNVIYQLMQDFEIWSDDNTEFEEVEYGIFCIYEVTDNLIIAYNSKASTCREVDKIGKKPLDYFTSGIMHESKTLPKFINWLDSYFGREWFGTFDQELEFISRFSGSSLVPPVFDLEEDIDLDTVELDDHQKAVYADGYTELSEEQKEDIASFLGFEEEDWDLYKDKVWIITKNCPELDAWYSDADNEEFPYALIIDGDFYDALSPSAVESVLRHE